MIEKIKEIRERAEKNKPFSFEHCDDWADIAYLLEQIAALQEENTALKSDLLDGSKTGYETMKKELTTLKDYNHSLKLANDTTYENYKKLEQENAELKSEVAARKDIFHRFDLAVSKKWEEKDEGIVALQEDNATLTKALDLACVYIRKISYCNPKPDYFIHRARSAINSKEGDASNES